MYIHFINMLELMPCFEVDRHHFITYFPSFCSQNIIPLVLISSLDITELCMVLMAHLISYDNNMRMMWGG